MVCTAQRREKGSYQNPLAARTETQAQLTEQVEFGVSLYN